MPREEAAEAAREAVLVPVLALVQAAAEQAAALRILTQKGILKETELNN